MIKVEKKYLKFILPSILIIILIVLVLIVALKNSDINKLSKVSKEITSINSSLQSATTADSLDYDKTCDILKQNLSALNNVNSDLEQINLKKSSYEYLKKSLCDYTSLNVSLYNSALNILTSKTQNNFSELYNKLITDENNVFQASDKLTNTEVKLSFPNNSKSFFSKLNKYVNDLYKENRETDITRSQKLDFSLYLNNVISNFSTLKQDMQPALLKIREEHRDLSVLLQDINNKKSSFTTIKNGSYSVSIPSGAQDYYQSLEDMLNSYEVYINSLEKSVKTEISEPNSNDLESTYADSFDKYNSFLSYYDTFKNAITEYKNK